MGCPSNLPRFRPPAFRAPGQNHRLQMCNGLIEVNGIWQQRKVAVEVAATHSPVPEFRSAQKILLPPVNHAQTILWQRYRSRLGRRHNLMNSCLIHQSSTLGRAGSVDCFVPPKFRNKRTESVLVTTSIVVPDEAAEFMKSSRKGAVRAARLEHARQAHSWIGKDWVERLLTILFAGGTTDVGRGGPEG
jgi:hypothetical protein